MIWINSPFKSNCEHPYATEIIFIQVENSTCHFPYLGIIQHCFLLQYYSGEWFRSACFYLSICFHLWYYRPSDYSNFDLFPQTSFLSSTCLVCNCTKTHYHISAVFYNCLCITADLFLCSLHERPSYLFPQFLYQAGLY